MHLRTHLEGLGNDPVLEYVGDTMIGKWRTANLVSSVDASLNPARDLLRKYLSRSAEEIVPGVTFADTALLCHTLLNPTPPPKFGNTESAETLPAAQHKGQELSISSHEQEVPSAEPRAIKFGFASEVGEYLSCLLKPSYYHNTFPGDSE